jgi:hypothetical protein
MQESNFYAILGALIAAPVRSFVVGGVSASLRGAPGRTLDVDLVHCREPIEPCSPAARTRGSRRDLPDPAGACVRPTVNHLTSAGRQNSATRYGLVDLSGTVGRNLGYPELLRHLRGGHWRGDPCPRARFRNTDCHQGSNWRAKEARRAAGPPADTRREEKEQGGDSRDGCNFSNLKAPTFHRRPKLKAGRYSWDSGRVK